MDPNTPVSEQIEIFGAPWLRHYMSNGFQIYIFKDVYNVVSLALKGEGFITSGDFGGNKQFQCYSAPVSGCGVCGIFQCQNSMEIFAFTENGLDDLHTLSPSEIVDWFDTALAGNLIFSKELLGAINQVALTGLITKIEVPEVALQALIESTVRKYLDTCRFKTFSVDIDKGAFGDSDNHSFLQVTIFCPRRNKVMVECLVDVEKKIFNKNTWEDKVTGVIARLIVDVNIGSEDRYFEEVTVEDNLFDLVVN